MSIFCCTFAAEFDTNDMHLSHSEYYIDRRSESDLCSDFPGDEILINGLHAMQLHFWNNNIQIDIPVVSVMNAAHYLVAYMMATSCSGDQGEYDVLAYMSVGHDKQMYLLTMVVLAAMLKRTDGFRARNCRNVILENRSEDFDEGVTLYERFLSSAEHHFTEEDFLIDVPALVAQNTRLEYENSQLKYQIAQMEEKYTQINIGTQNNNCTINQFFTQSSTAAQTEDTAQTEQTNPSAPAMPLFRFIHPSITDENERLKIHQELQNLVKSLPLPDICRYLRLMWKNQRVYLNVKPDIMFAELHRIGMPDETTLGFSKKNFMSYFNIND